VSHTFTAALILICVVAFSLSAPCAEVSPAPSPILDLLGNRADKNSVGHGRNVALYTGRPSKFFFATHSLGDIFSAVDGPTVRWYPDQVIVSGPDSKSSIQELRQICVTEDDVVVARIHLTNASNAEVTHTIEITGDCRKSADWRNKPGGEKSTTGNGNRIVMIDRNVYPEFLSQGLAMVVGSSIDANEMDASTPGAYRLQYRIEVPANQSRIITFACAIDADADRATENLDRVLKQDDPVAINRQSWEHFFNDEIPRFECSDSKFNEIYAFRWFLLKFSTAGGNLGLFKYPVVMEGRQAFQTYCCYSAPFMAMDLNWVVDRIELEIWWMDGATRHSSSLEGYRRALLPQGQGI